MSTTVLLVDDHEMMRDGLCAVMESAPEVEVIGEADNGRAAVELARELLPDAVVMDIGMPDLNGIEASRQILSEAPDVKVVALSMHSDEQFVMEMLDAGASDAIRQENAELYVLAQLDIRDAVTE